MNEKEVRGYLKRLKIEVVDELNGWVRCKCPFAFWKHDRGYDNEQRFGVTHDDDDPSHFNCLVCGEKGPFASLPGRLGKLLKDDSLAAIGKAIERDEILGGSDDFGEWEDPIIDKKKEDLRIRSFPDPASFLAYPAACFQPDALRYLLKRGITYDTVVLLGLRYDVRRERILFPVFDYYTGRYVGCSGRLIWSEAKRLREEKLASERKGERVKIPKVRDYGGLEKRKTFLGTFGRTGSRLASTVRPERHHWIIVEGLLAYARFIQLGYRDCTLAILGSDLTPAKAEILKHSGKAVYYFVDPDAGGDKCLYGTLDDETGERDNNGALNRMYGEVMQFVPYYPEHIDDPDKFTSSSEIEGMIAGAELYIRGLTHEPEKFTFRG